MSVTVAKFLDVAGGVQANQFSVGDRYSVDSISDLDETYKQLMDMPIPVPHMAIPRGTLLCATASARRMPKSG